MAKLSQEEIAEKLHGMGHEVAAAAVRRSALVGWDPKRFRASVIRRSHTVHTGIPANLGFAWHEHKVTEGYLPKAIQPGTYVTPEGKHYFATRVGKSVGPTTLLENLHQGDNSNTMRPRYEEYGGRSEHPLATAGHGLHPDHDPTPESFKFLMDHLDKPHVWPIIADHFEESGRTRGLAMARLLRHPLATHDRWLPIHNSHKAPITWPVRVQAFPTMYENDKHVGFDIGTSKHRLWVPKDEAHAIIQGLK